MPLHSTQNTRSFISSHNKSSLRVSLSRLSRNSLVRRSISYVQICWSQLQADRTLHVDSTDRYSLRWAGCATWPTLRGLSCKKFKKKNRTICKENWTEIQFRPWIKYDVTKLIFMKTHSLSATFVGNCCPRYVKIRRTFGQILGYGRTDGRTDGRMWSSSKAFMFISS
jgi:hypothetical protein